MLGQAGRQSVLGNPHLRGIALSGKGGVFDLSSIPGALLSSGLLQILHHRLGWLLRWHVACKFTMRTGYPPKIAPLSARTHRIQLHKLEELHLAPLHCGCRLATTST